MDILSLKNFDISPVLISLKLALVVSVLLLIIGIPLAYVLCFKNFKYKSIIRTLITLPMVLPPTVIGFYYLIAFNKNSIVGNFLNDLGLEMVFSFHGLVLSSIIYSLPFMIQPLCNGFEKISNQYLKLCKLYGKTNREIIFKVVLPSSKNTLLSAFILCFAHTMGEFGIVLMVGGNIPYKTRVTSTVVYENVEILNYDQAHLYALLILILSFILIFGIYSFSQSKSLKWL